MKKTRIISLILALTMIFGVLSVLPVSAEETETASTAVDILAQNVVYGEKVQIAYAVDVPLEDASKVTVEYYLEGAPETTYKASLLDTSNPDNVYDGKNPVFATLGFHATDFTDVVYATAYIGDEAPENAVYKKYSVAEYFYAKLYKDDYINKVEEESDDSDRANLYLSMIDYGKYAQKVLVINKGGETTLITDYCYLWTTEDGITINGAKSALVAPEAAVTLAGATNFVLTKVDGETAEATASYTAEAGMIAKVAAALGTAPVISTFDDGNTANSYVSHTASASYIQFSVVDDPTGAANKVLQVERTSGTATHEWTTVKASNSNQAGNCITFETDIYVERRNGYLSYLRVYGKNSSGEDSLLLDLIFQITTTSNGADTPYIAIKHNGSGTYNAGTLATTSFVPNKWVNIRLEFYRGGTDTTTYTKLFIDDDCVLDGNYHNGSVSTENYTFDSVRIWQRAAAGASGTNPNKSYFDNIYVTKTDKVYVAETAE